MPMQSSDPLNVNDLDLSDAVVQAIEYAVSEAKNDTVEIVSSLVEVRDHLAIVTDRLATIATNTTPQNAFSTYEPRIGTYVGEALEIPGSPDLTPYLKKIEKHLEDFIEACADMSETLDDASEQLEEQAWGSLPPVIVFIFGVIGGIFVTLAAYGLYTAIT